MSKRLIQIIATSAAGLLYWQLICVASGVREPWDAGAYWVVWYPLSLALCGVAGWMFRGLGWAAGVLLTFMQLPILWTSGGVDPGWQFAPLFLFALALPAAAIAAGVGWFARRR